MCSVPYCNTGCDDNGKQQDEHKNGDGVILLQACDEPLA
jgi:hypothetical protein